MTFNSVNFVIFFPIVVCLYYLIPKKAREYWLLLTSYFFYMCWNIRYALLLLFVTVVTYVSGLLLDRIRNANISTKEVCTKGLVGICVAVNLGVLFFFKYSNFISRIINDVTRLTHIQFTAPEFDILLPVGISFFTFQSLGYMIDVYRKTINAEKNFFRYALFVSFFPQLVAGPIERSERLLPQFANLKDFQFAKARDGLLMMLWGFFLKIVIADRIAIYVDSVFGDYNTYPGVYLIVAAVLFAIQIYCDFYGYSTIAIGAAEILGIDLMENFDAPYLSRSVSEFWRRWHISLTSWFRDYLYIPLGGSRKGKVRKYFNEMVVFLVSGLWHGANFSFIVWGGINGLYQVLGEALQPMRKKLVKLFHIQTESVCHRLLQMAVTFVLVDFSWIFFRANGCKEAVLILKSIYENRNVWVLFDGSLFECGLDSKNWTLLLICLLVLLLADICRLNKIKIREVIAKQDIWARWLIIVGAACAILLFGIYGPFFEKANFIYFQF